MEPAINPPPAMLPPPARGIFGTNIPVSVTSTLAFLLFFLPFAELRCTSGNAGEGNMFSQNTGTAFSNSGMGLALGLQWKTSFGAFGREMGMDNNAMNQKEKPNYYALAAWILALATALFAISRWRWGRHLSMFFATLSLAALIGLFIDLKSQVKDASSGGSGGEGVNAFTDVKMELVFTAWYYGALVLLAATIWLAWKRGKAGG